MSTQFQCPVCQELLDSSYLRKKHFDDVHDGYRMKGFKHNKPVVEGTTQSKILQGEQLIKEALRDIDTERNILSNKLRDLDTLAAKYKYILNPNGKPGI